MSKFFVKVSFLIILPLIILGIFLPPIIDNKLANSNLSNYKEWNDIFDSKINADLIIQGSSRAWVHISPYVIDSTFALNSYNMGCDGYDFQMQYCRFILYCKFNRKPKYILQNIEPLTLSKNQNLAMIEQYIPYLNNDIIKKAVLNYKGFDSKDFYIPFTKYSHTLLTRELILQSFLANPIKSQKYKGFQAQNSQWDTTFYSFKKKNLLGYHSVLDEETKTLFVQFLNYCKYENIKVVFVYTPEYIEAQKLLLNRDSITNIFKNFAISYDIPMLDYSTSKICHDTINFYNSQHLNIYGVRKFNNQLAIDLKGIITN